MRDAGCGMRWLRHREWAICRDRSRVRSRFHVAPMPRLSHLTAVVAAALLLAPLGCVGRARAPESPVPSPESRVHFLLVNDVYIADTLRDGTGGVARLPAL